MIFIPKTQPLRAFVSSWFYYFVRSDWAFPAILPTTSVILLSTISVIPSVSRDIPHYRYEDPSTSFTDIHFAQDDNKRKRLPTFPVILRLDRRIPNQTQKDSSIKSKNDNEGAVRRSEGKVCL